MRWGRLNPRGMRRLAGGACFVLALPLGAPAAGALATAAAPATPNIQSLLLARTLADRGLAVRVPASTKEASQQDCSVTPGLICSTVTVPLDWTGQTPGTISLHVEYLPAEGFQRGVMFLLAGGPGQGSAHVFSLDSPAAVSLFRFLFPGYGLAAYDDRGTGASGLLNCPALQRALTADDQRATATACADIIGPTRAFYSTADHAEDLEAVRRSLGVDKIGLYGVSYGTKLALAYALAHPDHVERLGLVSVLPAELPDPYNANVLRSFPDGLNAFCSDGGCRSATSDYAADVAAVANALAAKPIQGKVLFPSGGTGTQRIDGLTLLSMVVDADLSPGLAAELPAAIHAMRAGNTQPLLRLALIHDGTGFIPSGDLSFALYAATVCRDGPFPWAPDTPTGDRQGIVDAALKTLPAGTFGPFGSWSWRSGNADFCLNWPSPAGGAALGPGPLPNVPVLAVSGGFDLRTPTSSATSVIARFPQGHLLVVPAIGHDPVDADPSACAAFAVRAWMQGGAVPSTCPRPKPIVPPVPALPAPGVVKPRKPAGPLQTYTIASKTIREAEAMWLMASSTTVAGIYGGKLVPFDRGFTLSRYTIARGVALTGTVRLTKNSLPFVFAGTVTVSGAAASPGILGLNGTSLRGTLGGRVVGR